MIKALFFDVDGTLVSFNTHKVPESTIEALREAHKRGVKLFTATGRPRQLLNNITEVEDIMDGFILATGAQCVYGDKVVRQDLIPTHEAEAIVDFCNRLDGSGCRHKGSADYQPQRQRESCILRHAEGDVQQVRRAG